MTTIGYADPPYPGQSAKHYSDHPDYAGEVDHQALLADLVANYDGWVLHTSAPALPHVLDCATRADATYRVMAWVKPFAAFKRNVSVAYAWEPVLVSAARKPEVTGRMVMRDWFSEPITMKRGLAGAKPERLCHWLFEMVGAHPDDEMVDLFPGSGAVTRAWETWRTSLLVGGHPHPPSPAPPAPSRNGCSTGQPPPLSVTAGRSVPTPAARANRRAPMPSSSRSATPSCYRGSTPTTPSKAPAPPNSARSETRSHRRWQQP